MTRRPRLQAQEGISLIAAIFALALMMTLAGVTLQQAVQAMGQSHHQVDVKRALEAADAAIEDATFAVARADIGNTLDVDVLNPTSVVNKNCVVSGSAAGIDLDTLNAATPAAPSGKRWCPETTSTAQTTSDGATYTYRTSELLRAGAAACGTGGTLNLDREVVGVGRSGVVVRRVKAKLNASLAVLSGAAVQASGTGRGLVGPPAEPAALTLAGTSTIIGNAQSNGSIKGGGANVISGNATPGQASTTSVSGAVVGGSTTRACQAFSIPEVDQASAPTVNDNTTVQKDCVSILVISLVSCVIPLNLGSATIDAGRNLIITGTGRARLPNGGTYSFCSIQMSGDAVLQVQPGAANTRIFIDDPANCTGASKGTINVSGGARIVNCHLPTKPESLQIYAVGSTTTYTTQTISSSLLSATGLTNACGAVNVAGLAVPMTLIAPHSTITLGASTDVAGQVAGDRVEMMNAARVTPVNALVNISRLGANPVLPLYKATQYRECSSVTFAQLPAEDPAQGC